MFVGKSRRRQFYNSHAVGTTNVQAMFFRHASGKTSHQNKTSKLC